MNDKNFLPPPVRLSQAFDGETCGGGRISRRTFIKRTGGATVATMIAWNMTAQMARAEEGGSSSEVSFRIRLKYTFHVVKCPNQTNQEQIQLMAGLFAPSIYRWKTKKIPPNGDGPDDVIKSGPWDAGLNEFYALYVFNAYGPGVGDRQSVSFGGYSKGKLMEDDDYFLSKWLTDDDDLEALASIEMQPTRTWSINEQTGEITYSQMVKAQESPASPGSGYAKIEAGLGWVAGRVMFDYAYVNGFSGALGVIDGSSSGTMAQASTRETAFGFFWEIRIRKTFQYFDSNYNLIREEHEDSDLPDEYKYDNGQ